MKSKYEQIKILTFVYCCNTGVRAFGQFYLRDAINRVQKSQSNTTLKIGNSSLNAMGC